MSEWHTVNVTGVSPLAGRSFIPPPSFSSPLLSTGDFQTDGSEEQENENISAENGAEEEDGDEDSGDIQYLQ